MHGGTDGLRGFETFTAGETGPLGDVAVTRDAVVAFAGAWDPQPFHLDEAAGRASPLGGHAASGWHTCAMLMRNSWTAFCPAPGPWARAPSPT